MTTVAQKIKTLRRETVRTFLLLFGGHAFSFILTIGMTKNPSSTFKFHAIYFAVYFSIALIIYFLAPKLVKNTEKIELR